MVTHPVQSGVGEDNRELAAERQITGVSLHEEKVGEVLRWKALLSERNHGGRRVDAHDSAVRRLRRYLGRHFAVAAANIEHVLVATQVKLLEQLARPHLLLRRMPGVVTRIPLQCWHHIYSPRRRR